MAMARKHRSQALEADALHFSTDVWSSCVVLFGLGCVWLGPRVHLPWMVKADAVAALGVALIVARVSFQLGRRTVDALLDATPPGVREAIAEAARVPGVLTVKNIRVRRSGAELFADVALSVRAGTGVEQAHDIADRVESAVRTALPGSADVVVHVEPAESGEEDPEATVRLLAARRGLTVHSLSFCEEEGGRTLELHIEVEGRLSVAEAHAQVEEFEAELRRQLPGLGSITAHIEPRGEASLLEAADSAEAARIARALHEVARELGLPSAPHDIRIRQETDGLAVSLHCSLDPSLGIRDAHALTEKLEQGLRSRIAEVRRVVIHAEPGD
jgi:divalent metal cation (Fe/Co/Zn/Cd) transporter